MAKGKEWGKQVKKLNVHELTKIDNALETLLAWDFFKQEYGWTGLSNIKYFVHEEQNKKASEYFKELNKR